MHGREAHRHDSARDGTPQREVRHGDHVRGRRPGSRWNLRKDLTMATATISLPQTKGGAFLIEDRTAQEVFTPEDLTEEHLAIGRTAEEFWNKEVEPNIEAL